MKSTFDQEMEDPSFKKKFEEEYKKFSDSEEELEKSLNEKVIGLTLKEAKKFWDNIRVVIRDGQKTLNQSNFVIMRMNVEVVNNKIVSVVNFG